MMTIEEALIIVTYLHNANATTLWNGKVHAEAWGKIVAEAEKIIVREVGENAN